MRLDQEGDPGTIAGLLAGFADFCPWLEGELTLLNDVNLPGRGDVDGQEEAERTGSVRLYPAGLTMGEPIETQGGPFVVIVDGDLVTTDYIRFSTDDYIPGLIVITGDLRAGSMFFESGARVMVQGSAVITQACFGRYGDENALLDVQGELVTPLLALDGCTPAFSERGVRSVTYSSLGWWEPLKPDILLGMAEESYFQQDLLKNGTLDFERAFAAAREGAPLFMPGVEESFPQRLEARPAVSEDQLGDASEA